VSYASLNIPQTVFTVFYAIMWGALANALPRWRAYDTAHMGADRRARRRFLRALTVMNLLPIVYCVFVLWLESGKTWNITGWGLRSSAKIFLAILPCLAPFGFYRLWSAMMQHQANRSYPTKLWRTAEGKRIWTARYPGLQERELSQKLWKPNVASGAVYIFLPLFLLGIGCALRG
jgi:hypothetical protein